MDRPEDVPVSLKEHRSWICSKCGQPYDAPILTRTRGEGNTECQDCGHHRGGTKNSQNAINNGRSIRSMRPDLAEEWHPTLNG